MSAQVGRALALGEDPRPDAESAQALAALFAAYARNVFDYCGSLLGDQAAAADATQVTLTVACMLVARLDSHFRVRAWLLALARAACKSTDPGRREEPLPSDRLGLSELLGSRHHAGDEIANTGQGELNSDADFSEGPEGPVLATLSRLPAEQREVLELVYRHCVRPAELPAVLAISADHAQTLLT